MNELQIFNNDEFGEIRTAVVNNEPMFCLIDICKALELSNSRIVADRLDEDERRKLDLPRQGETWFVTESGLYAVILRSDKPNAKKFRKWVTSEVLPSIRKTGSYTKPMTTAEKIQLLAQGNEELNERVDKVEDKVDRLENDAPLYGCEIDEIQKHVRRKGVDILGGKQSEAYKDRSIRSSVYSDIYSQLKREYGCVASYKSIKRKYIADAHEFIDCYIAPVFLQEQISCANVHIGF
jgi:prophage antirepressor-like protein|nr:MAG TPA: repressor domain protein [Bacteriophage sp.]